MQDDADAGQIYLELLFEGAKHATALGIGRNFERNLSSVRSWSGYLRAEHSLIIPHRQLATNVASRNREWRMLLDANRQEQVAVHVRPRPVAALPLETKMSPV